jgi:hypothetical protein
VGSSYYDVAAKSETALGHNDRTVPAEGPLEVPADDGALAQFEHFYSSLVSDALDRLGKWSQVLAPEVSPFHGEADVLLVGFALPRLGEAYQGMGRDRPTS